MLDIKIIWFKNNEVLNNMSDVLNKLEKVIETN